MVFTMMRYNNMIQWTEYVFKNFDSNSFNGTGKTLSNKKKKNKKKNQSIYHPQNAKKGKNAKSGKKPWTKKKKIALGIVAAGLLATVVGLVLVFVFDLGPVRPIRSTKEEARVVGKCAGYEVRYEELRYIANIHKESLNKKYGEYSTLSDEKKAEYEKELKDIVLYEIENNYVILSLCDKYGVDTDSKDVKKHVNEAIEDLVDELGGKKAYKAWLAKNNLTDAFLRLTYKVDYLETLLIDELTQRGNEIKYNSENLDKFVDYIMESEDYVKVIHAFYPKDEKYYNFTKDPRDPEARANDTLNLLLAAKDDEEKYSLMVSAIGSAPFVQGYSVTGSDYYITYGQMHEKYDEAAFALDEYGVSEVVELEEGYYVIMRVPKVRKEAAPRADELVVYYKYAVFKSIVDKQRSIITFTPNDYFNSLTLAEIKRK